jgi:hypothetical protein
LANFKKIIELFTQKIVTKLSRIWVRDPGSEIQDPEKTYSGSRIQGLKRHRIPDPDPQHCLEVRKNFFSHRVVEDWNRVPPELKKARTVKSFKTGYTEHRANSVGST